MRIDETKIFEFRFPFYQGELCVPIRANTREEAVEQLKGHLNNMMVDLAAEFPKAAPAEAAPSGAAPSGEKPPVVEPPRREIPTYALELDIETLVKELMPIKKPKGAQTIEKLVKDWTGFAYAPENYAVIIEEMRRLLKP